MRAYGAQVMIEWRANAPKWQQVADILIAGISDGTYPPDSQLPSQHELAAEYGIALNTAQKIMRRLREQGWAYSVKGVGTFVAPEEQRGAAQGG